MKKTAWLWIGLVALLVIGGALVWMLLSNKSTTMNMDHSATENSNGAPAEAQSGTVDVAIKDMAFSPATIKVKKGTKVVWTNQDAVGHNAVADSAQTGGLPTEATLLQKGKTQAFTFDTVGTFSYHCTPHPFMHGSVEVVE